ncbi:MAG: hypothetical protein WCH01_12395 [Methylococcaceae bacterium]
MIPTEKVSAPRLTPAERCTQAYEQYLHEARDRLLSIGKLPPENLASMSPWGRDLPVTLHKNQRQLSCECLRQHLTHFQR